MNCQGRNHYSSALVATLLLACCLGAALGAPRYQKLVERSSTSAGADPLLAMPTDEEYIQVTPAVQPQLQQQEQAEVYQQQQPQQVEQPQTELRQEIYYVTQENYQQPQVSQQPQVLISQQPQAQQQYQEVHEVHEQPDQQQNNQRQQEYVLVSQQQQQSSQQQVEYPGQIVYVGQNGEISKIIQESQSPTQTQEQISQNIGDMVSPSSALPATILTEVPLKDLPGDVLEKLRRDYGVKVVATRDRPGANLIINCDDNGQEQTSICAKPDRSNNNNNNNNNNGSPYAVEAGTGAIEEQLAQVMGVGPVYSGPSSRSYFLRGPALEAAKEVTTTGQDIHRQYAAYIQEQPTASVNPEVLDKSQYDDESSLQSRQQAVQQQQQQQQVTVTKEEANQAPVEVEQQQQQYGSEQTN